MTKDSKAQIEDLEMQGQEKNTYKEHQDKEFKLLVYMTKTTLTLKNKECNTYLFQSQLKTTKNVAKCL